jgi:NAD+ diphosphatase
VTGSARFELAQPPRLSRATVERDEPLRLDDERLAAGWAKARVLVVDERGGTPVQRGRDSSGNRTATLVTKLGEEIGGEPPSGAALLGEQDGVAYWALRGAPSLIDGDDP